MENRSIEELKSAVLNGKGLPRHIAIIMDGNGRWAKGRGLPRVAGHKEGVSSVREVTRACGELDIEALTLYTFSSENWKRPKAEVNALMKLLVSTIRHEVRELMENNVRLKTIGRMSDLPATAQKEMAAAIKQTSDNTGLTLVLALSYGGRQEILDGVTSIARLVEAGELAPDDIDAQLFERHLTTPNLPDPDLIIRTSGEEIGRAPV